MEDTMVMTKGQVPITRRTLIQRINRRLAPELKQLCASRDGRVRPELGDFYEINLNTAEVEVTHVDPEKWGQEMGVLKAWETVVD